MATSYNGWPASPDAGEIGIDTSWSVLGSRPFNNGGFPSGVKDGSVARIFRYLVSRLHAEVEPIMTEGSNIGYGCWGYSFRANVNNPSVLSCHASGTAIDYNAPRHPNGTVAGPNGGGGWTAAQVAKIREILADLDGVVRWLSGNDPMHFEIAGTPAAVDRVAAKIGVPGKQPTEPIEPEDDMPYSEADLTRIMKGALKDPEVLEEIATRVWSQIIKESRGGQTAWAILMEARDKPAVPDKIGDVVWSQIIKEYGHLPAWALLGRASAAERTPDTTYTVVAGDTLSKIAAKFSVSVGDLVEWNGINDPSVINVGQVLTVGKA